MNTKKYVYPKLPSARATTPFARISGNGLGNCLFVYARAIKYVHKTGAKMIHPTWLNISIGPILRNERDKRFYTGIFNSIGEITWLRKFFKLCFDKDNIRIEEGLDPYFADLLDDSSIISEYLYKHTIPTLLEKIESFDFTNCVAVHIRLGDYPESVRVPIEWYKGKILSIKKENPLYKFLIFSDGRDEELVELTNIANVQRVAFGSSISDIFAISKCCYLIGSDSTFSGWGAFLGQVPCCFYRKHYGPVLKDSTKEIVECNDNRW